MPVISRRWNFSAHGPAIWSTRPSGRQGHGDARGRAAGDLGDRCADQAARAAFGQHDLAAGSGIFRDDARGKLGQRRREQAGHCSVPSQMVNGFVLA